MNISIFGVCRSLDGRYLDEPADRVRRQIREYERGERTTFDLSISYPDDFTGAVMREMASIPYGETRTYGTVAADIGTAPIAVGGACGRNPLPIVVPCHRVVGIDSLVGYAGGLALKRQLLRHEGADLPD